ncbi:hypothetical protein FRC00_009277, partial [Tulasnella sp. 408]
MADERPNPSEVKGHGTTSSLREPHAKGGKSEVYKATLVREPDKYNKWQESKIPVAVKKLRFDDDVDQDKAAKAFVRELGVLDGLNHPNVAKLLGFVEDLDRNIAWLVSTWEPNGNVREFLLSAKCTIPERISLVSDHQSEEVPPEFTLPFGFQIRDTLEGLVYLHTREPPICHGDLKSFNILVNATYNAVITDFGSARFIKRESEDGLLPPSTLTLQTTNDTIPVTDNAPELVPN